MLLAGGCSDGRSDASGSTTTVKHTTTTTTAGDGAATSTTVSSTSTAVTSSTSAEPDGVVAGYLAFWDLYIGLGGTPPPFDAATITTRLDELTTGAERTQLFDFLQKNAATGLVLRGDIDHAPKVASNDGTVAVVEDCMDDRTGVYRVADNSRVDTDDPARRLYTTSLRLVDDRWKVETVSTSPEPCTV
mgnify:CR=1 FL=1